MNKIIYILLIATAVFASCATAKRTSSSSLVRTTDTVNSIQAVATASALETTHTRIVRDTVVSVPLRTVADTLDWSPVYNADGVQVLNSQKISGKGVSVTLTPLPNGKIAITGACDSMAIVIAGLTEEVAYYRGQYDSLFLFQTITGKHYTEEKEAAKRTVSHKWVAVIVVAGFIIICVFLFKKFIF